MTKSKILLPVFIKGFIVVAIAFLMVFLMNMAMQNFLDEELAQVQIAAEKAAEAEKALLEANSEEEKERLELQARILKLEQEEQFYQQYKNRESYHYYGQFYEMFENVHNADVIFLGTSHASHGVNPKYIEEANPEHSFFNFALNGSNPQYYSDWYEIFKESGYPTPKTIIFCVDWFMCDDGWLWRRIDFDTSPDKPVDIMRKIENSKKSSISSNSETENTAETSAENGDAAVEDVQPKTEEKKVNWWDVDEMTTLIFNQIPLIYSRDRIPEMIKWLFGQYSFETTLETEEDENDTGEEEEELKLPVYKHSYLVDPIGNVTSDYYKGFIPWEAWYDGSKTVAKSNDSKIQWKTFEQLIKQFQADGIEVIFVEVPEYLDGRIEKQMEENNDKIEAFAKENGIEFYNYNEELASEINDDYTNYSDWGHLNTQGSTAFSKLLGEDLKEILK